MSQYHDFSIQDEFEELENYDRHLEDYYQDDQIIQANVNNVSLNSMRSEEESAMNCDSLKSSTHNLQRNGLGFQFLSHKYSSMANYFENN